MIESEYGTTELAMNQSRFHGDQTLLVRFFMHPWQDKTESAAQGRPIYVEKPYIEIMQPGNKDSIIKRPASERDKQRFPEHWRKFQAREDQDTVTGTLLEEWPGVTRSQCEELKFLNVRTVEQLAEIADSNAQNIMGIAVLKQKAQRYLEASKEEQATKALAEVKDENAELRAMIEELQAKTASTPAPKKRGRPRKEETEEAED
jgi:hypothetical protein